MSLKYKVLVSNENRKEHSRKITFSIFPTLAEIKLYGYCSVFFKLLSILEWLNKSIFISLVNDARLKSFCDSKAYSSTYKLKALFMNTKLLLHKNQSTFRITKLCSKLDSKDFISNYSIRLYTKFSTRCSVSTNTDFSIYG